MNGAQQQAVSNKIQRDMHMIEARKNELTTLRNLRMKSMDMACAITIPPSPQEIEKNPEAKGQFENQVATKAQEIFAYYIMDGLLEADAAK